MLFGFYFPCSICLGFDFLIGISNLPISIFICCFLFLFGLVVLQPHTVSGTAVNPITLAVMKTVRFLMGIGTISDAPQLCRFCAVHHEVSFHTCNVTTTTSPRIIDSEILSVTSDMDMTPDPPQHLNLHLIHLTSDLKHMNLHL